MKTIKTIRALRTELARCRQEGARIGFVPTMGCLHQGHMSLVAEARKSADVVVLSIFVNPKQFPPGGSEGYPRNLQEDRRMCRQAGVDVLFVPDVCEMYPTGFSTTVSVGGTITQGLCGESRPGHFDGVATVVTRLMNIVGPDLTCFGEKDAQQLAMVRQLSRDLCLPGRIQGCPTVREASGLAMSSRNRLLSAGEKDKAAAMHGALKWASDEIRRGERRPAAIRTGMKEILIRAGAEEVDYATLVDPHTMAECEMAKAPLLLAVSAVFGGVRLIDNLKISR